MLWFSHPTTNQFSDSCKDLVGNAPAADTFPQAEINESMVAFFELEDQDPVQDLREIVIVYTGRRSKFDHFSSTSNKFWKTWAQRQMTVEILKLSIQQNHCLLQTWVSRWKEGPQRIHQLLWKPASNYSSFPLGKGIRVAELEIHWEAEDETNDSTNATEEQHMDSH